MLSCCVGLASSVVVVDSCVMPRGSGLSGVVVVDSVVMPHGSGIRCNCC